MKRLTGIFVFILGMIIVSGCGDKINPGEHKIERPVVEGVVVEKLMPMEVTEFYEASGTVRAVNTSLIAAKIMGDVEDVKVKVSDIVRKGDVILVINSPDIEARVETAREALGGAGNGLKMAEENRDLSEKTFARFRKLYEGKAVTEQEFDEIKTKRRIAVLEYDLSRKSFRKAEATLNEALAFRSFTLIKSPVNGIVAEKKIDKGSMTAPGMPLLIIEEPVYRVEVSVDEGIIPYINKGMSVEIFIDALNVKTTGRVGEIVRRIDPETRTFKVKINLDDGIKSLRGGFYSRVRIPVGTNRKLLVDETAVVARGELTAVYAVNGEGVITMRLVKTGKKKNGRIEILSGLNEGDHIIIDGVDKAIDGGRVR